MLLKSVFIGFLSFSILYADTLKECKTEADKISGCVVKEYDENGNLEIETPYKNNKREGIEKWYHYENGNLALEASVLNDILHGDIKLYTEDKKLLALVKAENGRITSGKCFNNKALTNKDLAEMNKASYEKAYKYLQEICLKESDSNSTLYADTLKECKTEADKISGCVVKEYYVNDNLWLEIPHKNGKREGIARRYYENGNLVIEVSYKNDELHGDLKYYTEDKKLLATINAQNDKFISGKCPNNKALTDKDLTEIRREDINIEQEINYLKEICLKSDSK